MKRSRLSGPKSISPDQPKWISITRVTNKINKKRLRMIVSYITLTLWFRDGTAEAAAVWGRWRLLSRTRKQVKRQPIMNWKMDRKKKRRWWWKWKLTRRAYHWRGPNEEGRSGNVSFLHLFIYCYFCFLNLNMEMMMTEKEREELKSEREKCVYFSPALALKPRQKTVNRGKIWKTG